MRCGKARSRRGRAYDLSEMDVERIVAEIETELRSRGKPDRARKEKSYLKSQLEHYGTPVPDIRAVAKTVDRRYTTLDHKELIAVVTALWVAPVHERRMAALELLVLHKGALQSRDIALLERLLRESQTWALVDGLAASVVGDLVARDPSLGSVLDRWSTDRDFWIRRSALLALLGPLRNGEGDFARFSRYADGMLEEKQFFIRKAIGWVLRETAKKRPVMVYEWLLPRAGRASGVTLREAVKPLSDEQRSAVLAAR
jgi:3-methyladenine DNA glycosylase AlkD